MKTIKPRVALASGTSREAAVGRALELVRDDIAARISGRIVVKPNLVSATNGLASTQPDAVRPVLEFIRGLQPERNVRPIDETVIAEGSAESTSQAYRNFGYDRLAAEFGVTLVDLNESDCNRTFEAVTLEGGTAVIPYADRIADADTIISVAVAKVHNMVAVSLSLKNMIGAVSRDFRRLLHGYGGVEFDNIAELLECAERGRPALARSIVRGGVKLGRSITEKLGQQPEIVAHIRAAAENLARLGKVLMPDIAVIDAFRGMEGEGPNCGEPVEMGLAVAGIDTVACDAVMAHLMGFDPLSISYLALADERRMGVARIEGIEIVGEHPAKLRHPFKRHSNDRYHMRWREAW
jgi:uncharacterized protein (DUF362 family)